MTILVEQSFTWLWEIKGAIIIRWHYLQFHTQAWILNFMPRHLIQELFKVVSNGMAAEMHSSIRPGYLLEFETWKSRDFDKIKKEKSHVSNMDTYQHQSAYAKNRSLPLCLLRWNLSAETSKKNINCTDMFRPVRPEALQHGKIHRQPKCQLHL